MLMFVKRLAFVCLESDAIELPATFTASFLSLVCVCDTAV